MIYSEFLELKNILFEPLFMKCKRMLYKQYFLRFHIPSCPTVSS